MCSHSLAILSREEETVFMAAPNSPPDEEGTPERSEGGEVKKIGK
jgi:hypothetical protein